MTQVEPHVGLRVRVPSISPTVYGQIKYWRNNTHGTGYLVGVLFDTTVVVYGGLVTKTVLVDWNGCEVCRG